MIEIRPCRLEECAAVLAMWARAGAIPSPTDSLEEVNRLVREHADSLVVAIRQGSIVGSIIGGWDGWRGNIYRLAVAPEARRAGLARRLVDAAERMLVSKGARRISQPSSSGTKLTPSVSGTPSPTVAGTATSA
jgi:ribosomal protein S18 acetylase RimI-like enzyme